MTPSFDSLLVVVAIAFAAPLALGLFPSVRLPSPVLEILAGIVVGPAVLGWAHNDQTVAVMATIGLSFLLFLAGIEIGSASCAARFCGSQRLASRSRSS